MRILATISILFIAASSFGQSAKLKIWLDPITEQLMQQKGMEMDHGVVKKGVFIINDYTAQEREWLENSGIKFEVIQDDVEAFYAQRSAETVELRGSRADCNEGSVETFDTPDNFELGSMGGFYTYEEFLEQIDSMFAKYPAIITQRQPIDTFLSHENRPIYWLKISDNATTNESEPEVLYTSIHHAREPQSLSQLIFYMWYLLENYGNDDEVTHLVNNTEMYFVPMINPDGYRYNQVTNPNGGGLWRKNRRDNLDGQYGVDLNRNYGYEWAYDNSGSSPSTSSETYRGPSAFSEPETKAIEWFSEQHEFQLALNYHSHGNYLIYPWGYIPGPLTPDSTYFTTISQLLTSQNNYNAGTGYETVGYAVNGDSDDWLYGEQTTKNKIYSMTPEVGNSGDGFWPISARIIPISEENVRPNLLLSHFAGNYATMTDVAPQILSSTAGSIPVRLLRLGLTFDPNYTFSIEPVTSNISISTSPIVYTSMNTEQLYTEGFAYELDQNIASGDVIEYDLIASFGGYESRERITKYYGQTMVVLSHSASDTNDFNTSSWSPTTEDFVSSPSSITDSPFGFYSNVSNTEIEYERIIDMRQSEFGYLSFQAKWQIEADWDYCQILAAPLESNDWTPLCGRYTNTGTSNQDSGQPVWDGNQTNWVAEEINLNDFIGERIKIKFRLVSDQFVTFDGFYFDDLEFISVLDENSSIPLDTGYTDSVVAAPSMQGMNNTWTIYPNPANESLIIKSDYLQSATISIHDMKGAKCMSRRIKGSSRLDLSALKPGLYVVSIETEVGTQREVLSVIR